jgi:hypothetical protein
MPALPFSPQWIRLESRLIHIRLHKYYLVHHYYYLDPLISAMNKGFLKSIDLICSQRNLIL